MNIFSTDLGSRENTRKYDLPKKKSKQINWGLGYKREKSKIFFNKVYSGGAKGDGAGEGVEWEFGVSRCKLLYIE